MGKTLEDDFPPPTEHAFIQRMTGLKLLREPFPAHQISKLPKGTKAQNECPADQKVNCKICGGWHHPKIIHLDYVGHAALTDRLLDADPNWTWEPMALRDGLPAFDETGGLWIKLTVCGQTRIGYGHAMATAYKDIGSREKEVIGDALRNAAMRFGAALELWHKGELHKPEPQDEDSDEDTEWAEGQAMQIRALMAKQDIAGAALCLNSLGVGGVYDGEAKEAVWSRLESPARSAIKAYDAITQARTLDALKRAWDAAPKHSHLMLGPIKDQRKAELVDKEMASMPTDQAAA